MYKSFSYLATVVLVYSLFVTVSFAQLGEYEFDGGGDGTSWDEAVNWNVVLNPDGTPAGGGDPAAPPDAITDASIPLLGVTIDSTMPGQTARNVHIGTANGAGSLTLSSGGGLTASTDFNVGSDGSGANGGTFNMTGGTLDALDDIAVGADSPGQMTMSDGAASAGDDFFVNAGSSFTMTGGTLFVGDRLVTEDDANVHVDGGEITADDDFFFFGSSQITVDSGSMTVFDKLRFDDVLTTGKLTVNGGLVRSQEFGFVDDSDNYIMNGVLEINGDGVYQSEAPGDDSPVSQLSVAAAQALIDEGVHITTSEVAPLRLAAFSVVVPEFDGRTDVAFTQISIVPEPASVLLLGLSSVGFLLWRRTAH